MLKFLANRKTIRIVNYVIDSLAFAIILLSIRRGFEWNDTRYSVLLCLAVIILLIKMIFNASSNSKTNDELARQINLEIFSKTYSIVIPILLVLGLGLLITLGYFQEAKVVIITVGVFYYAEKVVRERVYDKYDYEESEEERD
ncbi:MAG: hypothetical protein HYZ10_14675 [Ignavibacteriales bacterium]|nr:hypothetical protein [Ignavibacteriales bacterium]